MRRFRALSNKVGFIEISVVAIFKHRNININNIAFLERSVIRNTMAYDFVD